MPKVPSIPGFGKTIDEMFSALQAVVEILRGLNLAGSEGLEAAVKTALKDSTVAVDALTANGIEAEQLLKGIITRDESERDVVIPEGHTLFHPYLTILPGQTYTNNGRMVIYGTLSISGTLKSTGSIQIGKYEV